MVRSDEYDGFDLPKWMRWSFIAINRIGFPIVAFLMMFWLCNTTIRQNTLVLERLQRIMARAFPKAALDDIP